MSRSADPTRSLAPDVAEAIAYSVYQLVEQWEEIAEQRAREFGLTGKQAAVLLRLSGEKPSMRNLAETFRCDASNITGLVGRLEGRGLVHRTSDSSDSRVRRVHLTPSGEDLVAQMRLRFFDGAPSVAGLSPPDQQALLRLLRRAVDGDRAADRHVNRSGAPRAGVGPLAD